MYVHLVTYSAIKRKRTADVNLPNENHGTNDAAWAEEGGGAHTSENVGAHSENNHHASLERPLANR